MYVRGIGDSFGDLGIFLIVLAGVVMIATSGILFNFDRGKPAVIGLYLAGCAAVWVGAFLAMTQTIVLNIPAGIPGYPDSVVIEPRWSETDKYLFYISLFFWPVIAAWVFLLGMRTA